MSEPAFTLHPRLAADCRVVADLPVSRLLLMEDQRFPWCILVPRQPGLSELQDLPAAVVTPWFTELGVVSRALNELPGVTRVNVGALGNLVPQLHVHVVGRHPADSAWPGPVWGHGSAEPYPDEARARLLNHLKERVAGLC